MIYRYLRDTHNFLKAAEKLCDGLVRLYIESATIIHNAAAIDPYVKITDLASGEEYAVSKTVYNTASPEWGQVFYIPHYNDQEKYTFIINTYNAFSGDVTLSRYTLDLEEIVKN